MTLREEIKLLSEDEDKSLGAGIAIGAMTAPIAVEAFNILKKKIEENIKKKKWKRWVFKDMKYSAYVATNLPSSFRFNGKAIELMMAPTSKFIDTFRDEEDNIKFEEAKPKILEEVQKSLRDLIANVFEHDSKFYHLVKVLELSVDKDWFSSSEISELKKGIEEKLKAVHFDNAKVKIVRE